MTTVTPTDIRGTRGISNNRNTLDDVLPRFKTALITLPSSTTNSDTTEIDIAKQLGMKRLMGVVGFQTDTGGVIAQESGTQSTTAVVNNSLTISVNGTAGAASRSFLIYGL